MTLNDIYITFVMIKTFKTKLSKVLMVVKLLSGGLGFGKGVDIFNVGGVYKIIENAES